MGQVGVLNYSVTRWALTLSNEEARWSKVYKVFTRKIKTSLSESDALYAGLSQGIFGNRPPSKFEP